MTATVHRNAGEIKCIVFTCDQEGCTATPTSSAIIAGGGLVKLGWIRRFNTKTRQYDHFCPEHRS